MKCQGKVLARVCVEDSAVDELLLAKDCLPAYHYVF